MRLPAPPSGHVAAAPEDTGTAGVATRARTPLRILVADDNVDAGETMCALLEASGYETRIAYDGAAALALGETFLPHLALLDLGMPRLDGFETAQRMRASPQLRGTVLVAVTGWGAASDRERSRAAGFDHHLMKPASMQQVQEILAAVEQGRDAAFAG